MRKPEISQNIVRRWKWVWTTVILVITAGLIWLVTVKWWPVMPPLQDLAWKDWTVVMAELLVALVIWWELRANRVTHLAGEAFPHMREAQVVIYQRFAELPTSSFENRREQFRERAWNDDKQGEELRKLCDAQIVRFSTIWFIWRGQFLSGRKLFLGWPGSAFDVWFPHVVVPFWAIAGRYVIQRGRERRGRWTYHYLAAFTYRSILFLERQDPPGTSVKLEIGQDLDIRKDELSLLKREVKPLVDEMPWFYGFFRIPRFRGGPLI
jgi:hypothetical protein